MNEKCYSNDGEEFRYESIGEMIDDTDLIVGDTYYDGDTCEVTPDRVITAREIEHILENLDSSVYEDIGECYDNSFSNVTLEASEELRQFMVSWANKHVALNYWKVINVVEKQLTIEDIE